MYKTTGVVRLTGAAAGFTAIAVLLAGCQSTGAKPNGSGTAGAGFDFPSSSPPNQPPYTLTPPSPMQSHDDYYLRGAATPVAHPDGCVPQTKDVSGDSTSQIMQTMQDEFGNSCGFMYRGDIAAFLPSGNLYLTSADYDGSKDAELTFGDGQIDYEVDVIGGDKYLRIVNQPYPQDNLQMQPHATGEVVAAIHREYGSSASISDLYTQWVELTSSQWSKFDSDGGPGAPFSGLYTVAGFADVLTDSHGLGWSDKGTTTVDGSWSFFTLAHPPVYGNAPGPSLEVDPTTGLPTSLTETDAEGGGVGGGFDFTPAANSAPFVGPSLFISGSSLG